MRVPGRVVVSQVLGVAMELSGLQQVRQLQLQAHNRRRVSGGRRLGDHWGSHDGQCRDNAEHSHASSRGYETRGLYA